MIAANVLKTVARSSCLPFKSKYCRSLHYKGKKPNYYEILRLRPNCTSRDIKRAYIDLSKKFHPDRNNNADAQRFLAVSEAYSILSKDDLRRDYDIATFPKPKAKRDMYYGQSPRRNPMNDAAFYWNRDKSQDAYYEAKPYYGIKGLQRVSNSMVLFVCFLVIAVGIAIQVLAIRYSVTFRRDELIYQSELANEHLQKSRNTAEQNGNQLQLAILEEKFRSID